MGLSSSTIKDQETRGSWTIQVNLDKSATNVTYTITNTSDEIVKVIKSANGSTVTMIVNPKTREMTLDNNSTGSDGDIDALSEVLNHIGATLKHQWGLSCDLDREPEGDRETEEEEDLEAEPEPDREADSEEEESKSLLEEEEECKDFGDHGVDPNGETKKDLIKFDTDESLFTFPTSTYTASSDDDDDDEWSD